MGKEGSVLPLKAVLATRAIGESRAMDQMRDDIEANQSPFAKKQGELNRYLRDMKDGAKQYRENKSKPAIDAVQKMTEGRQKFLASRDKVDSLKVELSEIYEANKKKAEKCKDKGKPIPEFCTEKETDDQ